MTLCMQVTGCDQCILKAELDSNSTVSKGLVHRCLIKGMAFPIALP